MQCSHADDYCPTSFSTVNWVTEKHTIKQKKKYASYVL